MTPKMSRTLFLSVVGLASLSISSHATTVGFGSGPASRSVLLSSGAVVPTTGLVLMGTFSNVGAIGAFDAALSIAANAANMEAAGGWAQFGLNPSNQQPYAGAAANLES